MKKLISVIAFSVLYLVGCAQPQGANNINNNTPGQMVAALGADNGMDPNGLDGNGMDGNGLDGNGLDGNGLDGNGLDANGLDANGLDPNGLAPDGISTGAQAAARFNNWFIQGVNPPCVALGTCPAHYSTSDKILKYVTRCAKPAGAALTFTIPGLAYSSDFCTTDGSATTCSYPGSLGLAPIWSSNQPIPVPEQELISACLAAHLNANGETILVSFRGGGMVVTADENYQYTSGEATFWGNIFGGIRKVFMQQNLGQAGQWTPRGCTTPSNCAPVVVNPGGWSSWTNGSTPAADGSFTTNAGAQQQGDTHVYQAIATKVDPAYAALHTSAGSVVISVSGLPAGVLAQVNVGSTVNYLTISRRAFQVIPVGTRTVYVPNVSGGGHIYAAINAPASVTLSAYTLTTVDITYAQIQ